MRKSKSPELVIRSKYNERGEPKLKSVDYCSDDDAPFQNWNAVRLVSATEAPWYWRKKIHKATDPVLHWPRFESLPTAKRKQRARVRLLRKGDETMVALSRILESCKPGRRCGSLACIICRRRHRRWHVSECLRHLGSLRPRFHVTVALDQFVFRDISERAQIKRFSEVIRKRIGRKLGKHGRLFAWIEVDFDADLGGFLPHLHAISVGFTRDQLHALKTPEDYQRANHVPVKCVRIRNGEEMEKMTYTCKQFPPRGRRTFGTKHEKLERLERTMTKGPSLHMKLLAILGTQNMESMTVLSGVRRNGRSTRLSPVGKS